MTTTTTARPGCGRVRPHPWTVDAACANTDVELFFTYDRDQQREVIGAYCLTCPVQRACLEAAITEETTLNDGPVTQAYGIRGGHTPRQRQRLHRARNRGETPDTRTPKCNIPTRTTKTTPPEQPQREDNTMPTTVTLAHEHADLADRTAPGAVTTGPFWLVDCAECGTTIGHSCDTEASADRVRDAHNTALHPASTKAAPRSGVALPPVRNGRPCATRDPDTYNAARLVARA